MSELLAQRFAFRKRALRRRMIGAWNDKGSPRQNASPICMASCANVPRLIASASCALASEMSLSLG
jgi:hypothetical protein